MGRRDRASGLRGCLFFCEVIDVGVYSVIFAVKGERVSFILEFIVAVEDDGPVEIGSPVAGIREIDLAATNPECAVADGGVFYLVGCSGIGIAFDGECDVGATACIGRLGALEGADPGSIGEGKDFGAFGA